MVRILHCITGMGVGGAERLLVALTGALRECRHGPVRHEAVSLMAAGPVATALQEAGVSATHLGLPAGLGPATLWRAPTALLSLRRMLIRSDIDILHTWLYHADLAGSLACTLSGRAAPPLLWSVHNGALSPRGLRAPTRALVGMLAKLSRAPQSFPGAPAAAVFPSATGLALHRALGYRASRLHHIPNGVDTARFAPDREGGRRRLAAALDVPLAAEDLVLGLVARWDPAKDVPGFLAALAHLATAHPVLTARLRVVLLGAGLDASNQALHALLRDHPLTARMALLGVREDIHRLVPGLDAAANASRGETLPLAILEAMACGVPCVVTDVGDSAVLVGETGFACPPEDPAALAAGMERLLGMPDQERRALGKAARRRVATQFTLEQTAARYAAVYDALLDSGNARRPHPAAAARLEA